MTDEDLRRLAEAATPGEWRRFPTGGFAVVVDIPSEYTAIVAKSDPQWGINRDGANADYIAAANPETMKRLLDRVAKAEADALAARAEGRIAGMEEAAGIADQHWQNGEPPVECADAIRAAAKESTNDR